jgi:hypothetical protein
MTGHVLVLRCIEQDGDTQASSCLEDPVNQTYTLRLRGERFTSNG